MGIFALHIGGFLLRAVAEGVDTDAGQVKAHTRPAPSRNVGAAQRSYLFYKQLLN